MSLISADRFNELKQRVKAECTRRAYSGSVVDYAGTAYDYTITPDAGIIIKQEHRDKIATPLNAINSGVISTASGYKAISDQDLLAMEAFVTTLESRIYTDTSGTDCSGGCTGMCYGCQGTCYNGCTSCTGTCSTSCVGPAAAANTCSGNCTVTCTGCGSGCAGQCTNGCTGCTDSCSGCGSGCAAACTDACRGCGNSCSMGCSTGCSYSSSSCTGCAGGCSTGCGYACTAVCANANS